VLSWESALDGSERADDGHNVILHEFAHKLDLLNGRADGVPELGGGGAYDDWASVLSEEYALLVHDAERGHKTLLDPYGATNEAEFFAVTTEAFFEKSVRLRDEKPRLYAVFQEFYRQDPAARVETSAPAGRSAGADAEGSAKPR
jgi:Mlc titration factor MtfA (ptsG expression regulator)